MYKASKKFKVTNFFHSFDDADQAGNVVSCKSTSSYVFQIGTSTISWKSKLQSIVALSSTEAEYESLSNAIQEAVWLRVLLKDIGFEKESATKIFKDNQGAVAFTKKLFHYS